MHPAAVQRIDHWHGRRGTLADSFHRGQAAPTNWDSGRGDVWTRARVRDDGPGDPFYERAVWARVRVLSLRETASPPRVCAAAR